MMKLDGEKLLAMLMENLDGYRESKKEASKQEDYGDALMNHAAECTLENVIEAVCSGNYTIKD